MGIIKEKQMNSQNILIHHLDNLQFSSCRKGLIKEVMGQQASVSQRTAVSGNYLPGLRAVENDVETYFNNDFVWLGY